MAVGGLEKLMRQFHKLGDMDQAVAEAVKKQAETVRGAAVKLCPANHGELRGSIHTKVEQGPGSTRGIVYTGASYAAYVEFGTGPAGQADHRGISPEVPVAYRQDPWWIPADQIDPSDAERYGWAKIGGEGTGFYHTDGQPASPFMYPALKSMEKYVAEGIAADLQACIRKIGGSG